MTDKFTDWVNYKLKRVLDRTPSPRYASAVVIPISGELLNDEYDLINHPLAPFDPEKTYLVKYAAITRDVIGEWKP
jgi:hypothetical protein